MTPPTVTGRESNPPRGLVRRRKPEGDDDGERQIPLIDWLLDHATDCLTCQSYPDVPADSLARLVRNLERFGAPEPVE